jgi:hypothetical protein
MFKRFLAVSTFVSAIFIALPAFADIILPGRCPHMGYCWDQKLSKKRLVQKFRFGTLYSIELASRSWKFQSQPPDTFEPSRTSYVYCSTTRPAFIFQLDRNPNQYYAHFLNPGGEWYGYNVSSYPVYWETCHQFSAKDFRNDNMRRRALQLGYSLRLKTEQRELNNLRDFLK